MANLAMLNVTVAEKFGGGDLLYSSSLSPNSVEELIETVKGWPLMSTTYPTFILTGLYFWLVKYVGPEFMKNRKPFQLRSTLIWYNAFQVAFSAWLFLEIGLSGWFTHYDYKCQPLETGPAGLRMASICWWYFISKFTEFFDTFFFVLRKKNNQISTLHLFHHGVMPINTWIGLTLAPGGHASFFALLNTFIHVVMYSYYMISAMGPEYQKYIWWKKHLTKLQLIQFASVFVHEVQLVYTPCNYPKTSIGMTLTFSLVFIGLFGNFYIQSYRKSAAAAKAIKKAKLVEEEEEKEDEKIKRS